MCRIMNRWESGMCMHELHLPNCGCPVSTPDCLWCLVFALPLAQIAKRCKTMACWWKDLDSTRFEWQGNTFVPNPWVKDTTRNKDVLHVNRPFHKTQHVQMGRLVRVWDFIVQSRSMFHILNTLIVSYVVFLQGRLSRLRVLDVLRHY